MKSKFLIWTCLILLILLPQATAYADGNSNKETNNNMTESHYDSVLNQWKKEGFDSASHNARAIEPSNFIAIDKSHLLSKDKSKGYGTQVVDWGSKESVSFQVVVKEEGLYELSFDYYPLGDGLLPISGAMKVNGKYQYSESHLIDFPVQWQSKTKTFKKDRYGNERLPDQQLIRKWNNIKVQDANHMSDEPLKFHLNKGTNTITLENIDGEALIGNAYVLSPTQTPSYKEYIDQYNGEKVQNIDSTYEAEYPLKKNSSYIRPVSIKDPSVTPYSIKHDMLNAIGGDSWKESGQAVSWKVNVKEDGLYHLTFKALQNNDNNAPVFRSVLIDGTIPFKELESYTFDYSKKWRNITLSNHDGKPYSFYLTKGAHVITMVADAAPVSPVINAINNVTQGIDDLALSINKLTGNQSDRSREWVITNYIPDISDRLNNWADSLSKQADYLKKLSKNSQSSKEIVSLKQDADKLKSLAKSPNEIPNRLTELSTGSNSVAQNLGQLTTDLQSQPLTIDKFYVHGNNDVPDAEAGWWTKTLDVVKRFFLSFTKGDYTTLKVNDKDTVEVWVNRPRQYVELMQNMADQQFTPKTHIKVKFSIMPDENKLILANTAGEQPDVALGISNWLPYELAIRGAAVNLRQFDGFNELARNFSPGAYLPFVIDDGIYAMPETQDFNVLFYRKDILNKLNLPVPNTWDDVVGELPELQRYGMNFYTPIAGAVGNKPFATTAPFIYQFGGDLYKDQGMKTAIDSENALKGIQFMGDLNTIYSTPLQVPVFYNHFRYATLPMGISNFATYIQLKTAAPEIAGQWAIAPSPGVKQKDGTVVRWQTGSAQSAMMFKGSNKKEKAWEFMKWWESADTQVNFATSLQMTYGPTYMWNTANITAFKKLPWPEEDKKVILEQWKYLKEIPKTPGSYMLERELSNIWNDIVFNNKNTRASVDDAVIVIDREFERKMEEFGYMKDGKVVKPYRIPTIDLVKKWLGEEND